MIVPVGREGDKRVCVCVCQVSSHRHSITLALGLDVYLLLRILKLYRFLKLDPTLLLESTYRYMYQMLCFDLGAIQTGL